MIRAFILAAFFAALAGPALARDANVRVVGVYACVNAANDRRLAETALVPRAGKDRDTSQYRSWKVGMDRIDATFQADVRRCMTPPEVASLCLLSRLKSELDGDIAQCGLKEGLPKGRF